MNQAISGRIFAVKTTGGQEKTVANFINTRLQTRGTNIYSVVVFETMKGYVFIEAPNAQIVGDTISGLKHVRSQIPGIINFQDIEKFLITKSIISDITIGDTVEVTAGPFKGMQATITRVEAVRKEVTVVFLDAPYQLPVTIDADNLKLVKKTNK